MALITLPSDIKPIFSGHETFALRQLWLRKAFMAVYNDGEKQAPKSIFTEKRAIEYFGVGRNMVTSIRHWGLACDVIEENSDGYKIGFIGNFLFGENAYDPYLEREATIWLIHWLLAGRAMKSTTWYILFNCISSQSFQITEVIKLINDYASELGIERSDKTLSNDIATCLHCYIASDKKGTTEDSLEPLLTELDLLSTNNKGLYFFNRGAHHTLPDEIFAFTLLEYWKRWKNDNASSQSTLSFNLIAHGYGSPGRVFKLSEDAVGERLSRISDITDNYLVWTDNMGIRQISQQGSESINDVMIKILRKAYNEK